MRPIQRVISIGFATAALASASLPALSWSVWPDVDFEWYANVGKPLNGSAVEVYPAPREGYIWAPGRYETVDARQRWVPGRWIRDDYAERVALQVTSETLAADGHVPVLYDRYGNAIPVTPDAYPVGSAVGVLPPDSNRR
jgi:hypothetical protein